MTRPGKETNGNYTQCKVSGRNGGETERQTDRHKNQEQTYTSNEFASINVRDEVKKKNIDCVIQ